MKLPYWLQVLVANLSTKPTAKKAVKHDRVYIYPFMDGNLMTKRAWEQKKEERIKTNINNIGD